VYVATPNHEHHETVLACAAASRDVLCEKPMALGVAAARDMAEACRIAGVRYATAHNQRHHPAHCRLRDLVRAGTLGQVTQARVLYACTAPAWWNDGDWHFDPDRAGGGAVADLAPHGIDLLDWLCDALPERAVALAQRAVLHEHPVEDGGVLAVAYGGELIASIQVAYHHAETLPRRVLELIGTDGMARAIDTMGQDAGGRLELFDARDGKRQAVSFDVTLDPFRAQIDAFLAGQAGDDERDVAVIAVLESVLDALPHAGALGAPARAQGSTPSFRRSRCPRGCA
jgi:1,5-anhydro-D-fructose reductase (1,5-anhydro-D-mannitol-forming)